MRQAVGRRVLCPGQGMEVGDTTRPATDMGPMITAIARERFDRQIKDAIAPGPAFWPEQRVSAGPVGSTLRPFSRRKQPRLRQPWQGHSARSFCFAALRTSMRRLPRPTPVTSRWERASGPGTEVPRTTWPAGFLAGMVSVNDAVTPTAHAGALWWLQGQRVWTHPWRPRASRVCPTPGSLPAPAGGFRPQLFPYGRSSTVERFLAVYRRVFHRG